MRKIKIILSVIFILALLAGGYFFVGSPPLPEKISWGVNFSQEHAKSLGLDWKETYSALIDDLGAKKIKIAAQWDIIEPEEGKYDFSDLDWQIEKAESKGVKILFVLGMKTPRWPECHIPGWAKSLDKERRQKRILELIEKTVLNYRDYSSVWAWQVENEPLFTFGECPPADKNFLKKEIDLVKSLDPRKRPVIISDSGEGSFWFQAARLGDIVGATMYRKVWISELGIYLNYPFTPAFYWRKAEIIKKLFKKEVIVVELQAEPWGKTLLYGSPIQEQEKTMNLKQFKYNVEFAKKTGFNEFYLWGAEWMYWMKEKQNKPEIWQEAKKLFR